MKADQRERMWKKNVRLTEDCRHGFKQKAINHKINSCQTYIRHFGRFRRFSRREFQVLSFSPLEASGSY